MSSTTDQHRELLTWTELAEVVLRRPDPDSGAAHHAVWRLCREGMPYIRAAGARLFAAADCLAWLRRRAEAQAAARAQSDELAAMVTEKRRSPKPKRKAAQATTEAAFTALARSIRRER